LVTKQPRFNRMVLLGVLVGVLLIGIGFAILINRNSNPLEGKVQALVRATFPKFCIQADHRINVVALPTDTTPDAWEVHCDPNPIYLPKEASMLTINLKTCDVTANKGSLTLMEEYPELFTTPKLANCPSQ